MSERKSQERKVRIKSQEGNILEGKFRKKPVLEGKFRRKIREKAWR